MYVTIANEGYGGNIRQVYCENIQVDMVGNSIDLIFLANTGHMVAYSERQGYTLNRKWCSSSLVNLNVA